jgi:hypothetical protein
MTLNELIKLIPIDHRDSELLIRHPVSKKQYQIEMGYVRDYGLDSSKIMLDVGKEKK